MKPTEILVLSVVAGFFFAIAIPFSRLSLPLDRQAQGFLPRSLNSVSANFYSHSIVPGGLLVMS